MKPYQLDEVLEKINGAIKSSGLQSGGDTLSTDDPAPFTRTVKNLS
jgi:hypothetical protein